MQPQYMILVKIIIRGEDVATRKTTTTTTANEHIPEIQVQPDGELDIRIRDVDPNLAPNIAPRDVTVPELEIGLSVRISLSNGTEQRGIITYFDDNIVTLKRAQQKVVIGRHNISYYIFLKLPRTELEEDTGLKVGETYEITTVGNYITYFVLKSVEDDGLHGRRGMEPCLVSYSNILTAVCG